VYTRNEGCQKWVRKVDLGPCIVLESETTKQGKRVGKHGEITNRENGTGRIGEQGAARAEEQSKIFWPVWRQVGN
jgi:hypothetical protein